MGCTNGTKVWGTADATIVDETGAIGIGKYCETGWVHCAIGGFGESTAAAEIVDSIGALRAGMYCTSGRIVCEIGGFEVTECTPATIDNCASSDTCESACGPVCKIEAGALGGGNC